MTAGDEAGTRVPSRRRNVKYQGCAIQLLTNHRICVLEGLNADRDDSSFIEVSTPLEKLVRARLESGRALAIPSAPFPLPAAPALGHAAHPNPHRRPPQARTKLTSCTTQDAEVIAPRIFTKVTIYDIDDFRKVKPIAGRIAEDNGFNPTGHETSREIFKLSRIVDYEYVQPMVDMRGAYCPETETAKDWKGDDKIVLKTESLGRVHGWEGMMVMYDRWSQYRPYQRGDPSTCKPIFEVCPKAGECDPATQYCDCTTYDDCENEPTASALKAWYMGVSAGFDGGGRCNHLWLNPKRGTNDPNEQGSVGSIEGKSDCTTPAPCPANNEDCDDDDNSKSCADDLDHLIGTGFNPNLDGQDHVNKDTVELDISTTKHVQVLGCEGDCAEPDGTKQNPSRSENELFPGETPDSHQATAFNGYAQCVGRAEADIEEEYTNLAFYAKEGANYNSGNPIQHRFYDHTVPDPSTAPIDLPDAYFLYQQRGLRGDIIKMRQLLSGKDHDTFDADLPCFKDVTIESRRVGSAQDNPRDTSTLNDIQAKSALTMTYELGTGKFAAEFILRATGGEGRNMLLGGKAEDVLCPFSPPPSAPPPLPSAPPSPPLPCPPPPECLAETRVFDSDGNPPVGVECSADYFCDPGLMARGGDLEHVSLDVMSVNPPEWISPIDYDGREDTLIRWKVVWMRQGTLRNYGFELVWFERPPRTWSRHVPERCRVPAVDHGRLHLQSRLASEESKSVHEEWRRVPQRALFHDGENRRFRDLQASRHTAD